MLKVRDVTLIIDQKIILNKISFDCEQNTLTTFLGSNGAGKTSLFEVIAGYKKCNSGIILYKNQELIAQQLGFARDSLVAYPDLSLEDNLAFILNLNKLRKNDYIKNLIDILGLSDVLKANLKSFSKGYQQKANLLLTIATNPEILILDEPNANLDPIHSKDLRRVIEELKKDKIILLSTHHGSDLIQISDQIINIQSGQVAKIVTDHSKIKEYYLNYVSTYI